MTAQVDDIELEELWTEERIEVDISRILEFVSVRELERYENEDMRRAAEAEAAAMQVEAEERAQRRLERNARVHGAGPGKQMLNELDMGSEDGLGRTGRPAGGRGDGQTRGRGRGRGRSRGRSRGRQHITLNRFVGEEGKTEPRLREVDEDAMEGEKISATPTARPIERIVVETEDELDFEEEMISTLSPIMRSAFVANSALPMSPLAARRKNPEVQDTDDSEQDDSDRVSLSSAAAQLMLEMERPISKFSDEDERIKVKRRRTTSTSSSHRPLASRFSASVPQQSPTHDHITQNQTDELEEKPLIDPLHTRSADEDVLSLVPSLENGDQIGEVRDSNAEEFIVESIQAHFYQDGVKYYLVKWEGYDDAMDWLPGNDLEGAAELVVAYNDKVKTRKDR
jgi:hypothetical protein